MPEFYHTIGGSWISDPQYLRSALRNYLSPSDRGGDVGLRLARSLLQVINNDDRLNNRRNNMKFVKIKPGKFIMGSPETEQHRYEDETQREVEIKEEFEMQTTPVTQAQWREVMGSSPSYFKGDENPVESVSYDDCQEFIKKLNASQSEYIYRLPTEEEWEYACRAGSTTAYPFGETPSELKDHAWFYENSCNKTHPVGLKKPNAWGLYDMLGNVWEWTSSIYE